MINVRCSRSVGNKEERIRNSKASGVSCTVTLEHKNIYFSLQPFPKQALVFTCLHYKSFENTVGKGEIALSKQFLHFSRCFLSIWRTF